MASLRYLAQDLNSVSGARAQIINISEVTF